MTWTIVALSVGAFITLKLLGDGSSGQFVAFLFGEAIGIAASLIAAREAAK